MTVAEIGVRMSNRELTEWTMFYKIRHEQQQEAAADAALEAAHARSVTRRR